MVRRLLWLLSRWACSLRGHTALLHFKNGRMSMKCQCGYESPGIVPTARKVA